VDARPVTVKVGKAGRNSAFRFDAKLRARFEFDRTGDDDISLDWQARFQRDFLRQLKAVQSRLHAFTDKDDRTWLPASGSLPPRIASGPYQPRADFHVFVSNRYQLSKALLPAWLGQRGRMEFPAARAFAGEASIGHELIHVLLPNANRMLAEGLAVYLQHKLFPKVYTYPNFGRPLEDLIQKFLTSTYANSCAALWDMDIEGLERIPTPNQLHLRIGKYPVIGAKRGSLPPHRDEVRFIYAVAGSFVGFLLENPIADNLLTENNFGSLYKSTPLRPLERDPGAPDRWREFYCSRNPRGRSIAYSFAELVLLWKTYICLSLFRGSAANGNHRLAIPRNFAKKPLVAKTYRRLLTLPSV
jgi:hypothetical protein